MSRLPLLPILPILLTLLIGCSHKTSPTIAPQVAHRKSTPMTCAQFDSLLTDGPSRKIIFEEFPQPLRDSMHIACDEHRYQWLRIYEL